MVMALLICNKETRGCEGTLHGKPKVESKHTKQHVAKENWREVEARWGQ